MTGTRNVAVVCESTACIPPELARELAITVIPVPFSLGDENYLDGTTIAPSNLYERIRQTRLAPKTSPPSPGAYLESWRASDAPAVLTVTVNSRVSTLQRSAVMAQDLARTELPDVEVAVLDSLSAGMGQGFVAIEAARAPAAGQDLQTAIRRGERVRDAMRMLITLDTLEYVTRASRLPQVAAFVGSLIPIKPVILLSGGAVHVVARPRSRQRAIAELIDRMEREVTPGRLHVAVQHAGAAEEADRLRRSIQERFDCFELISAEYSAVIGGYAGPGLLGVAFYAEPEAA